MKQKSFGTFVVKKRIAIFIISIILMIPSTLGFLSTRINYDILDYLPENLDTVKGQEILMNDFGKGGFSTVIVDGRTVSETAALEKKLEEVDNVGNVLWYDDFLGTGFPMEMIPAKYYDRFNCGDDTMMAVFFDTSMSSDETMKAVSEMKKIGGEDVYITGMPALVTDLKDLCEEEEPVYALLAVICAVVVMTLLMDSFIIPYVLLISIGITVLYNMGTNFFFGEISYITMAVAAVLQLGVTLDYSIFLWHSFEEERKKSSSSEEAMAKAIDRSIAAVAGSSITTVAGFISLCFMSYTLGKDMGLVMAKGVFLGLIGSVTIFPVMILFFEKLIEKGRHKPLLGSMKKPAIKITKHPVIVSVIFLALLIPSFVGYGGTNRNLYYDMTRVLPPEMDFVQAEKRMKDDFDLSVNHIIIMDSNIGMKKVENMKERINKVEGVTGTSSLGDITGNSLPEEMLPTDIREFMKNDKYQLVIVDSKNHISSDASNREIEKIDSIIKDYDKNAMLIGEGPCIKDLVKITDRDFKRVSLISIGAIFLIIAVVMRSCSLPLILIAVIEFAIGINLGIPFYMGKELPFIVPITISTIQLGATVDYAILMTTRYLQERNFEMDKKKAIQNALASSMPSIIVSGAGFFSATFCITLYSEIDIVASMCGLIAKGAVISMLSVILILPSLLVIFDSFIMKTTARRKVS